NFQRVGDGAQDQHRRVARAAFDLREIALGRSRFLRELAARHAALGAAEPDHAAKLAGKGRVGSAAEIGHFAGVDDIGHDMHYNSCMIVHATPRWGYRTAVWT